MGEHLIDGEFQSDKYPWCHRGFVPLKLTDPMAWPVLRAYGQARREIDAEFADDLEEALRLAMARKDEPKPADDDSRTITVCNDCLRASCWHGEFMCDGAQGTGTTERTVAQLRNLALEHPRWWNYGA